jgi:sugar phosphate isomerase/epimerase
MRFRIALCNEVLAPLAFSAQCAFAAACGYDGLELAPFTLAADPATLDEATAAALRRTAAAEGVAVSGLHWLLAAPPGLSLASPEAALRRQSQELLARLIDFCAALGGTYLVHGSPAQRRLPPGEPAARQWVEEAFLQAGARAQAAGLAYIIEPLPPALTNCFTTLAETAAFLDRAGQPALRTMIDVAAAAQAEAEPPEALLSRWLPSGLIAHLHANDSNQCGPGQGRQRFTELLALLRDADYRGWIGVEPFTLVPDGRAAAARAIGYLRGIEEGLV